MNRSLKPIFLFSIPWFLQQYQGLNQNGIHRAGYIAAPDASPIRYHVSHHKVHSPLDVLPLLFASRAMHLILRPSLYVRDTILETQKHPTPVAHHGQTPTPQKIFERTYTRTSPSALSWAITHGNSQVTQMALDTMKKRKSFGRTKCTRFGRSIWGTYNPTDR